MNAQDLKNSILQLAVQGKLVEQRPEEGTAKELLEQIKAEKEKLIKEKKIKKEKPLLEIAEDEIPFEIPESWEWVRLGKVGALTRGSGIKRTETIEKGYPCIRYGELYTTYKIRFSDTISFVAKELYDKSQKIVKGDVAMTLTGENKTDIAMAATYEGETPIAMGGDMTCWSYHMMEPLYLVYLINSPYAVSCKRRLATGDIIIHISNDKLATIPIPVPPLAEQKRIVSKIEEILPCIDQYDKAYTKLETFNKKFPEDMKKSILQLAMQGKLVEQRPEEGTADELYEQILAEKSQLIKDGKIKKEKPLPEITEDEIPFEIPSSWKWVRFSEVMDIRDGTHDSPKYYEEGIPLVTSKNISGGGLDFTNVKYISKEDAKKINERSNVDTGDILFAMIGSIGNPVIVNKDRDFCVKNVALFKNIYSSRMDINYVYWFLFREQYILKKIASGGVQSFIALKVFRNYLFPLPPLAEQKRIVAKIEELLPYCDQLVK